MKIHQIPFDSTNIYSKLIYDYQKKNNDLASIISSFPSLNSLVSFSNLKLNQFSNKNRSNLSEVLMDQYSNINLSKNVKRNLNLLSKKNSGYFFLMNGNFISKESLLILKKSFSKR